MPVSKRKTLEAIFGDLGQSSEVTLPVRLSDDSNTTPVTFSLKEIYGRRIFSASPWVVMFPFEREMGLTFYRLGQGFDEVGEVFDLNDGYELPVLTTWYVGSATWLEDRDINLFADLVGVSARSDNDWIAVDANDELDTFVYEDKSGSYVKWVEHSGPITIGRIFNTEVIVVLDDSIGSTVPIPSQYTINMVLREKHGIVIGLNFSFLGFVGW